MEGLKQDIQRDTMKLTKYLKRYQTFHSEQKLVKLLDNILFGKKLPISLRSIDPTLLQLECSKFVINRSLDEKKASHKFRQFKLVGTLVGVIVAGIFSLHITQARKNNQDKNSNSSIKMTGVNAQALSKNNQDQYSPSQKKTKENHKKSNGTNKLSSNFSSISFDHVGNDQIASGSTIKYAVSDGAVVESASGGAILQTISGGAIVQNASTAAISTNLDPVDENMVYNDFKVNKGEVIKKEDDDHIKIVRNTSELLELYNKNRKGKKLVEKDLKILSQFDQELIANYASQFVGNPYVMGGNSLTNGCDCSHFVFLVLKNVGAYHGNYVTSSNWVKLGKKVEGGLKNARAGDIVVYQGHVGIYDGEKYLIEAKGRKYGITQDRRPQDCKKKLLGVRRFV